MNKTKIILPAVFLSLAAACAKAKADTTICQATPSYGSYCSDQTPGSNGGGVYNSLPSWVALNKTLTAITVADNQVWGLDANGTLWNLPNYKASQNWIKVTSGVAQISAGHNLLCQVSAGSHLMCSVSPNPSSVTPDVNGFQNVTWQDEGAVTYKQIALSQGNQLWAVDATTNLLQIADYTKPNTAIPVAAGVREMAIDGKGSICVTDANTNLYCSNWATPPTLADGWNGYYHSLNWTVTNTQLQNIALADGKVYGLDANGAVNLLPDFTNNATWQKIAYGGMGDKLAAATVPSTWTPASFASDEVAVLIFMGQSNSTGVNALPQRFIAPSSPNVWAVKNGGWNYLAGNANGTAPFTGNIAGIGAVSFTNWNVQSSGTDMNLGFNTATGSAANMAAFQWQALKNAGMKLPDLYEIHVGWASQGVDPQDSNTGTAAWTAHGYSLWQPTLTNTSQPSYALSPFSRRILYLALQNLLAQGKKPRIIGLQWNQWEADAVNPTTVANAPDNYSNLFNLFYSAVGTHFPVTFLKPLSTAYGPTPLQQMQTVFTNLAAKSPADYSILDRSTVTSNIFGGGIYGGGDGSVHYDLATQQWFAQQAIGACLTSNQCGTRITSVPSAATN